ncbi:unnamed protein product [Heligmosomoides polygyrus]|uniref:Transmembrane protein n=1 Tax=Heligmosomoides polygyrus TaxID=6339 RepID=A0A3P8A2Z7_HELPZ|nr:unnamed protein product [Heligmosomoides polygyrus]
MILLSELWPAEIGGLTTGWLCDTPGGRVEWLTLAVFITCGECSYFNESVTGCSSKCAVTTDKDLSCFNSTLEYYEHTLFGIMRNYVSSQLNLASYTPNRDPLSRVELTSATLDMMATVNPANVEDEKQLLSTDSARPIVEALVDNVLGKPAGVYDYVCPYGCERSDTPWMWCFIASAVVNVSIAAAGIFGMMQSYGRVKKNLRHVQKGPQDALKIAKQS